MMHDTDSIATNTRSPHVRKCKNLMCAEMLNSIQAVCDMSNFSSMLTKILIFFSVILVFHI